MRPPLDSKLPFSMFKKYYWLKVELQKFCRENGISASGSKTDISDRISVFLETGEIAKPKRTKQSKQIIQHPLTLHTVITENHKCSQEVRAFFTSVVPNFHFSTFIQKYFKQNIGKTYSDVVHAWAEEEVRKKLPDYKKEIAPQFEYNRFIRDFYADPNNKGTTREEAIKAWEKVKQTPGSNAYVKKV